MIYICNFRVRHQTNKEIIQFYSVITFNELEIEVIRTHNDIASNTLRRFYQIHIQCPRSKISVNNTHT